MSALFHNLPDYLGWHMLLSAAALGIGIAVSIPLGIWASKRPTLAEYLLGIAGILQTVPTLALLAVMVPILNAIGFLPAFVALTLYSFLPILASTVTGLRGVDPSLIEAARGLGMNDSQMLFRVQLPLASPVILSGIRTATVLVVGTATLATPVGGKSLGNYIFAGLNMQDLNAVLFGCFFTAILAIVLDQLVHLLEIANARRSKQLAGFAAACLFVAVAASCAAPIAGLFRPEPIVVGGNFTEQYILCELLKEKLMKEGFADVDQRQGMGETIQFMGLGMNKADVAINYTGNVWTTMMHRKDVLPPEEMYAEVHDFLLTKRIKCLGKLGFKNNYVFAVREETARKLKSRSIGALVDIADGLVFADDAMFFEREEWQRVKELYKIKQTRDQRSMDVGLLYTAIKTKKVDVITAYSSDGRIKTHGLVELDDPLGAIPTYDAILLVSERARDNQPLIDALMPLVDSFDIYRMKHANLQVDNGELTPSRAAHELLRSMSFKQ